MHLIYDATTRILANAVTLSVTLYNMPFWACKFSRVAIAILHSSSFHTTIQGTTSSLIVKLIMHYMGVVLTYKFYVMTKLVVERQINKIHKL